MSLAVSPSSVSPSAVSPSSAPATPASSASAPTSGGADRPGLPEALASLGERVAPLTLARERTLPVPDAVAHLFPDGGLVRGRVLSCTGSAATSFACSMLAPTTAAGGWVVVVDLPTLGLDAASELGVPLERVVAVDTGGDPRQWTEVVAAAAAGFDVVLAQVPAGLRPATVRKLVSRVQQQGAVVVVLGEPGALPCDGVLHTEGLPWAGIGDGCGHLRRRGIRVTATGRRLPGARRGELAVPA